MRALELDEIVSIEGGKIDAIYRGKRLVTSQRVVVHRNGLVIFVKDWFYDKLHGGSHARESMGDLRREAAKSVGDTHRSRRVFGYQEG